MLQFTRKKGCFLIAGIKKAICILITLILCISAGVVSNAKEPILQWTHVESMDIWLSIPSGKALCSADVSGQPGTTKITGTAVLSRKNANNTFTTVKTWSGLEALGNRLQQATLTV